MMLTTHKLSLAEKIRPGKSLFKKITLVIVDDHKLLREMWGLVLERNQKIEVIGESGEFDEAIEIIKTKRPDIVLLDINFRPHQGWTLFH